MATAAGIAAQLGDEREVTVGDRTFPLEIVSADRRSVDTILAQLNAVPDGAVRLVVGTTSPGLRAALERRRISWLDARGVAHLVAHGVDRTFGQPRRLDVASARDRPGLRLGHATVRAVQLVLDGALEQWGVSVLADRSAISMGSASNLLHGLSHLGFLEAVGVAPHLHFEVRDRAGLAEWFLAQPAVRARRARAEAFVYARDPLDLARRLARSTIADQIALSGGLAAVVSGAGMTAVPTARVWVDPTLDLVDAIDALEVDSTSAAPNVVLLQDIGRVATLDRRVVDAIPVAPPSRIWVDLHDEPRGEDQAVIYRETYGAF